MEALNVVGLTKDSQGRPGVSSDRRFGWKHKRPHIGQGVRLSSRHLVLSAATPPAQPLSSQRPLIPDDRLGDEAQFGSLGMTDALIAALILPAGRLLLAVAVG